MSNYPIERDGAQAAAPQQPNFGKQYKFTKEELRVIKDCNRESFYQRCLPLGTFLGVGAYLGVKQGFMKPSPRLGAAPKVIVGVIVGYFVGKFSYQTKCAEKLMQLPNSQLGEMLRQRRRGNIQEGMETLGPAMGLAPFSGLGSSDTYTDIAPQTSSLDIDINRPQYAGLDESQRPSLDSDPIHIQEEDMPPIQKTTTSYEELRKQNREEYQSRRTGVMRELQKPISPAQQQQPPSEMSVDSPPSQNKGPQGQKNKYGDVWG